MVRIIFASILPGMLMCLALTSLSLAQVSVVILSEPGSRIDSFDESALNKAGEDSTFAASVSVRRLTNDQGTRSVVHRALIVDYADSVSARDALDRFSSMSDIISVEFSRSFSIDNEPDDALADSSVHLPLIRAQEAWSVTRGVPNIRVGLVDTGLFFEHPDLIGQVWINPGEDLNNNGLFDLTDLDGEDSDGNGWVDDIRGFDFVDRREELEPFDFRFRDSDASDDGSGHGTNVAGILAAVADNGIGSSGVAPGISIVPLRAFAADGIGTDVDIAAAIIYGADIGLEILNLSFGDVYESTIMRIAVEYALSRGTTIVASGGNTGGDAPHYPSDYSDVISVVWLNSDGSGAASRATHGVGIDIGSPGSQIFTTVHPFGDDQASDSVLYGRRSGSSMAAPMVAGVAALLMSIDGELTPGNIRDVLTASATDIDTPGWDHKTASGRLNAFAAVTSILPSRLEIISPSNNDGIASDAAVVGYVLHADLQAWSVQIATGDMDLDEASWTTLASGSSQRYNDRLSTLSIDNLSDGLYTLRLVVNLKDGRAIEDRRRIHIDRTPPQIKLRYAGPALVDGRHGISVDLDTDDLSTATLETGGSIVRSDRLARVHGLNWIDMSLSGGDIPVSIRVSNRAGLEVQVDTTLKIPAARPNNGLFRVESTDVPAGYLLQTAVDLDGDGLREIVFNRFENGWLGDTLVVAEYSGGNFIPAAVQIANVFPRDVGDTDGDSNIDLLTQVGPATLILEQIDPTSFQLAASLIDTSSLSNPSQSQAIWSAAFVDIDDNGIDEVLSHNTSEIRILSADTGEFETIQVIANPTSFQNSELNENVFEQPSILEGDFDGDGLVNYLIGDGDGDVLMLEQDGNGSLRVSWTFETDRYSSATRYGSGDFDGDGIVDFVTYSRNWLATTGSSERETDLGIYYFWRSTSDDTYNLEYTLGIPGVIDRHGSMGAIDVDNDGDDELVLLDSPDLFVLDRAPAGEFSLVYHIQADSVSGPRSATMVVADFDGSGSLSLVYADAGGKFMRLVPAEGGSATPVPIWTSAKPLGSSAVELRWEAAGADSVTVYVSRSGSTFDPIATTQASQYVDSTGNPSSYKLVGWTGAASSILSPERLVRPHDPAMIIGLEYLAANSVRLDMNESMNADVSVDNFQLSAGEIESVLLINGNRSILLNVVDLPPTRAVELTFANLVDDTGLAILDNSVSLAFPDLSTDFLILSSWEVRLPDTVELTFSEPVASMPRPVTDNFEVSPVGNIQDVVYDPGAPAVILVQLSGINLSASGLNPTLTVRDLTSETGKGLADEGNTVRLIANATSLDNIVVYPNPLDVTIHSGQVRFAGLPENTSITVLTIDGVVAKRFVPSENAGEVVWDVRDKNGVLVPSGVYLIRFQHNDSADLFRKVVIIR